MVDAATVSAASMSHAVSPMSSISSYVSPHSSSTRTTNPSLPAATSPHPLGCAVPQHRAQAELAAAEVLD